MNSVVLIGRLTKAPDYRGSAQGTSSIASFTLAIDRPTTKEEKQTDFPRVKVFGKQADNCSKYLKKGYLVGIQGQIQTGSYKAQDGRTVYTTDVVAQRVEFLERKREDGNEAAPAPSGQYASESSVPDGFMDAEFDEDIPF